MSELIAAARARAQTDSPSHSLITELADALAVVLSIHENYDGYCMTCDGTPEWPCATARACSDAANG